MTSGNRDQYGLGRKQLQRRVVVTRAAIVDRAGTRAIDSGVKFTTLAISSVGVSLHAGVRGFARGVGVVMDCGCGGDNDLLVETY